MPQAPSPSMGIIWPTDNDDANVWAPIMDTAVRVVIDGHDHSTGNGAKVKISQLSFDADISFIDSLGGKHAITDLKAIEFFPSAASAMTGFSGAFFVSDGTGGLVLNELYYRSIGGTNIQVTTGGTLNVNSFTGGIGGDYGIVQALEIFDDGLDAYVFQQQVGAAVRQYAKLYGSDLHLFEFKAVGATPVPSNNITIKVPAALANTFVLTLPGALPVGAAKAPLAVDSAGNVTAGAVQTMQLPIDWDTASANMWNQGAFAAGSRYVPIPLKNGDRIVAIRGRMRDNVTGPTKMTVALESVTDGVAANVATSAASAGSGAAQTLPINGLTTTIASGTNYQVRFQITTGAANCSLYWVEVDYDRP